MFFFFNDTATTEIYTLSLHDALPILERDHHPPRPADLGAGLLVDVLPQHAVVLLVQADGVLDAVRLAAGVVQDGVRSEEHTSELQSRQYLVCRLLLEKKKNEENKL